MCHVAASAAAPSSSQAACRASSHSAVVCGKDAVDLTQPESSTLPGLPTPDVRMRCLQIKYMADPAMHSMPAVTLSPDKKWFIGTSLDNQILTYSTKDKFRQNRKKTFKGHTVAGYACRSACSPETINTVRILRCSCGVVGV